ncbi:hypothetical protein Smp_046180 [Schistosoma mansoni]|uniref:hypothetical protein n=1 Tax=Schistosoma mansoni TaxID=6183 RepID=UPI00022DC4AF|nr:hypothetical protein Smp_046180 [Schistosoma mansoni]|eukprot:XP_018650633.1 hypothetical protein Smp_046180 [Schistosoma mansoni]
MKSMIFNRFYLVFCLQLSDPLDDVSWKIMRKIGYEHGQGLGVNAHSVVEPVALSKQKGRSGLGSVKTTSSSDKKIESFQANCTNLPIEI